MECVIVEAKDSAEAMQNSGFVIGAPAIVTSVVASMATGTDRFSVFPGVRPMTAEEMELWNKFVVERQAKLLQGPTNEN
jgi:hypothetical protein